MRTRTRLPVSCLTLAACLAAWSIAVPGAAGSPRAGADAARTCKVPDYPGSGYFTSLNVRRVSCAAGRRITRAHYRCRTQNGPRGRCRDRVLGYRCSERRYSIPTELNGRVTCRRGERRVVYTYQQNT